MLSMIKSKVNDKKVNKLIQKVTPFGNSAFINNCDLLKEVEMGIQYLINFFDIVPIKINSQAKANSMALELIEIDDIPIKKEFINDRETPNCCVYENIRFLYEENSNRRCQRVESAAFTRDRILINILHLINHEMFDDHKINCNRDLYKSFLCDICKSSYYFDSNYYGYLCDYEKLCVDCKAKIREYQQEANEKNKCGICIRDRVIYIYDNLCYYIQKWDLSDIENNKTSIKYFLTHLLSILLYGMELTQYGYWNFWQKKSE